MKIIKLEPQISLQMSERHLQILDDMLKDYVGSSSHWYQFEHLKMNDPSPDYREVQEAVHNALVNYYRAEGGKPTSRPRPSFDSASKRNEEPANQTVTGRSGQK